MWHTHGAFYSSGTQSCLLEAKRWRGTGKAFKRENNGDIEMKRENLKKKNRKWNIEKEVNKRERKRHVETQC